jgi:hypothetical protein
MVKTKCRFIIRLHGEPDRNCGLPLYKDGWCKRHHPDVIANKTEKKLKSKERWEVVEQDSEREDRVNVLAREVSLLEKKHNLTKQNSNLPDIQKAIHLLIESGYYVGKLPTKNA